ncbi:hypothetical protein Hamer_G007248, partial [Homarus americanus]
EHPKKTGDYGGVNISAELSLAHPRTLRKRREGADGGRDKVRRRYSNCHLHETDRETDGRRPANTTPHPPI